MVTMEQLFPELTVTETHKLRLSVVNEWAQIWFNDNQFKTLEEAEESAIKRFKCTWALWDTGAWNP